MKAALLLSLFLVTLRAQALELASPSGNSPYTGGIYRNFKHLTLTIKAEQTKRQEEIEIQESTFTWRSEAPDAPLRTMRKSLTEDEHLQVAQLLEKEQFQEICGTFHQTNTPDTPLETLIVDDNPKFRLENSGSLAPSGYYRIRSALIQLKEYKSLPPHLHPVTRNIVPTLEGFGFSSRVEGPGFFNYKTVGFTLSTNHPGSILPPLIVSVQESQDEFPQTKEGKVTEKPVNVGLDVDELVRKINRVPWDEIVGRYNHSPGESQYTKFSIYFSGRWLEVDGLDYGPSTYMELKNYLLDLINKNLKTKEN